MDETGNAMAPWTTLLRNTAPVALLAVLLTARAGAEDGAMESDWLELVKGFKGSTMGVEMLDIRDDELPDMQRITMAIPKAAVGDRDDIEEVIVIGRRPDKPDPPEPLEITYEWVDDPDADNYGLLIRLGKDSNWPIRLFMNSRPGYIE